VLSVLVGHPFDLAKVRMQLEGSGRSKKEESNTNQSSKANNGAFIAPPRPKQESTMTMLSRIFRHEGIQGLYRGVSAPILAVAPIWATSFWGFDTGMLLIRKFCRLEPGVPLTIPQLCLAGGFSALPTALVMVPSERVKCLLQMQQHNSRDDKHDKVYYKNSLECARHLVRTNGIIKGLYKGTALTLMRDIPANIVYFGMYEVVKQAMSKGAATPPTMAALTAGALAGIVFWPVALPTDTLKSRYQTAEDGRYNNMGDVLREVLDEDGPGGLFRGMGPAMIRAAPANAVSFLGAELTKKGFLALGI
jgi:solute carrier family 25 (mitochondrial carnitine/acylcarnitine transporter), member 20/29